RRRPHGDAPGCALPRAHPDRAGRSSARGPPARRASCRHARPRTGQRTIAPGGRERATLSRMPHHVDDARSMSVEPLVADLVGLAQCHALYGSTFAVGTPPAVFGAGAPTIWVARVG